MTSRKDDLISLCYLVIFLLNGLKFPFSIEGQVANIHHVGNRLIKWLEYKSTHSLMDLSQKVGAQPAFVAMCEKILNLSFDE